MIIFPTKDDSVSWYKLLAKVRGTALSRIWSRVLTLTLISGLVTWFHYTNGWLKTGLTPLPFTFMGLALSVFLGFRNNTSYDRFWEGRKLWGQLVNTSRSFGRQIQSLIDEPGPLMPGSLRVQLTHYLIAYVHSLRCQLRGDSRDDLSQWISAEDAAALANWSHPPLLLAQRMSQMVRQAREAGWVDSIRASKLEGQLDILLDVQGGCERIKSTPVPLGYIALLHQLVTLYCVALPFGIVGQVGISTPVVVLMVSYAFFGLDAVGDLYEDPFEDEPSDLPLSAICRTIEVNLRQQLGETDLPPLLKPDADCVLM